MHRLDAPAARHELRRQPIEQFGMRGQLALPAEIVRRGYDPAAEVPLPDSIHHHAGGERMVRLRKPQSERLPALRHKRPFRGFVEILAVAERGWKTRADLLAGVAEVTADGYVNVRHDLAMRQYSGCRVGGG